MDGYKVTIDNTSKEFSAKERVAIKNTSNATKLDEVVSVDCPLVFTPVAYAVLDVHNERSENKDYNLYVFIDEGGNQYVTGSNSFFDAFIQIWDEMSGTDEAYSIKVFKKPSRNYNGKYFLTCVIV